jgi:uncharacterized protein YidB (DUF937 family)
MGLLDILNGMQNGPRGPGTPSKNADKGGMSPITMAILALLAYKAMKHMTGGSAEAPAGGGGAKLDQASLPGGGGGGLGDILGSVLGGGSAGSGSAGGLGDLLKGGLGSVLAGGAAGGAAGSILGGGLNDLLKQLQEGGQQDTADSWVSKGPNKDIAPNDLGAALGADQINTMMQSSGLSRQELLEGLSQVLPGMVDQLTPDGRMPSADELRRLL